MKNEEKDFLVQEILFPSEDFKIYAQKRKANRSSKAFHEEIEIKYFYEGNSMQMIGDDIIIAEPGNITVVNPYEIHTNMEPELYNGNYYLIIIDLDFLVSENPKGIDLRNILIAKKKAFTHCIKNDIRLQNIILQVIDEFNNKKDHHRQLIYNLVSELFILLLRDYIVTEKQEKNQPAEMRKANLISPALSKIFQSYDQQLSIDELADLCHVSKYYFCRMFKEEMGITVVQYITKYRISLADVMLRDKDKTIEEIAYRCGFKDISYFYRCYKKIKGVSPKNSLR